MRVDSAEHFAGADGGGLAEADDAGDVAGCRSGGRFVPAAFDLRWPDRTRGRRRT